MAAFVISTSVKQSSSRRVIDNIIRNSYFKKQKDILATTCVQSRWYLTTPVYFKRRKVADENLQLAATRLNVKQKALVIDIWKDMTVIDLAISAHQSIDNIYEVLSYIDDTCQYKPYSVIEDIELVQQVVKKLRAKYRIISSPKKKHHVVEKIDSDAVKRPLPKPEQLVKRHPIITVMGHVDHGKTTLLDALRNTSIVKTEYGGITQHIGAFNVTLANGEKVTFLDTPGHAAFIAMRARGANVTDIVVLVVAADDGVMEQTVQSIKMARNANVPIIVAINKIDKRDADIERAQKMLMEHGIQVEDLGGHVQSVNISAIKGTNLKELVEAINTQAELMNLRGDPSGLVEGVIIEASNNPKYGKVATVLIQRGTLRPKSILVSGLTWAKARCMYDHLDNPVSEAKLSEAVRIIGWRELPSVGDEVLQVENERRAHTVIKVRENKAKELKSIKQLEVATKKHGEHLVEYKALLLKKRLLGKYRLKREGPMPKENPIDNTPKVNIVIKGDVVGSVEAILDVVNTYSRNDECQLNVVHSGVGPITETDLMIAEAFNAIVYCFNVDTSKKMEELANENKIPIRVHNVIYRLVDDIKLEINNKLPMLQEEEVLGEANVLQQFVVSKGRRKWNVAGCRCYKGSLSKTALFRVMRNNEEIFRGQLDSMRHLKDEMNTIQNGQDCGLKFKNSEVAFEPGDVVVCYKLKDKLPETDWDPGF